MIGAFYIVCSIHNRWKSGVMKVMWIKIEKREQIAEIIRKFYNEWICMFGVPISNQFDIWYYFYTSFDHWNKFVRYSFQWSMDNTMLWRHSRIGFFFFLHHLFICSHSSMKLHTTQSLLRECVILYNSPSSSTWTKQHSHNVC